MIALVDRIKKADPAPAPERTRAAKDQSTPEPTPAAAIPDPEPAGMGAEYEALWNEAWRLADEIDNPQGAPLADRKARLPELDKLRERMAAIERQTIPTAPPGTWTTWESSGSTRDRSPDTCPAKCKRSGKCYAAAYYQGKQGKAKDCEPDGCQWRAGQ
jgi:hypothetical protein